MSRLNWVRTAIAVERAGSITGGARDCNLSQPAASQQIRALERSLGIELFERHRSGVRPTPDGARFLGQVSAPFDQIDWLLDGLDAGRVEVRDLPVVIGCQPEWFEKVLLPRMDLTTPIRARFGTDAELLDDLRSGRADIAITKLSPPAAQADSRTIGMHRYLLVASPALVDGRPPTTVDELAAWIARTPWIGFSEELPTTRRFWSEVTGSIQPTRLDLVAPDLRVVMRAVEHGLGASLLPASLCAASIEAGLVAEVYDVADMLPQEAWVMSTRANRTRPRDVDRIAQFIATSLDPAADVPTLSP